MRLFEPKPTPFASCRRVLVSPVQLYVLDWVSKVDLVHSRTPRYITVHLHYRQLVYQLLCVRQMRHFRLLKQRH